MPHPTYSRRRFLRSLLAAGLAAPLGHLAFLGEALAQAEVRKRMAEGQPSVTAYGTALQRAAHQVYDDPLVLDDPVAMRIVGAERAELITLNPDWYQTAGSLALRAYVVMRSRYAEDAVAEAVARGVRQYVVLGAGLDTFAYRNPYGDRLKVTEVDHPSTQAWKRERLSAGSIELPGSLAYAPVDFEKQTLADGLARAGFESDQPAVFSWLGVTMYLSRAAVLQTLGTVGASAPRGTEIVFDFMLADTYLSAAQRRSREASMRRVAALGEPWLSFFEPHGLAAELRAMGYAHVELLAPDDANRRYFDGRSDDLYLRGTNHLIRARV